MDRVVYNLAHNSWGAYLPALRRIIEDHPVHRVCEVGAGANPIFPVEYVQEHGLDYSIMDISEAELAKAPAGYTKIVWDVCSPESAAHGGFDLVFSAMLAEHVADGRAFHTNVYEMLNPNGFACHFFPTLYALPFLVNRIVPEALAGRILDIVAKRDRFRHDKFPALYKWCRGPSRRHLERFRAIGYEIVEYQAYFGHAYYQRVPRLQALSDKVAGLLVRHPVNALTSYVIAILRRPE